MTSGKVLTCLGFRMLIWHPLFKRVLRVNGNVNGAESEGFGECRSPYKGRAKPDFLTRYRTETAQPGLEGKSGWSCWES